MINFKKSTLIGFILFKVFIQFSLIFFHKIVLHFFISQIILMIWGIFFGLFEFLDLHNRSLRPLLILYVMWTFLLQYFIQTCYSAQFTLFLFFGLLETYLYWVEFYLNYGVDTWKIINLLIWIQQSKSHVIHNHLLYTYLLECLW